MAKNFASLKTAIASKLSGITQLAGYAAYHVEDMAGFPFASFEPSGNDSAFYTNTDNQRGYAFDIFVWQEVANAGRENAIKNLINAVDAVIAAFDADYSLSGACDFCMPCPSAWGEVVMGNATIKYAKITLVCKVEVQVVT